MKKEKTSNNPDSQEIAMVLNHSKDQTVIVKGTEQDGPSGIEILKPMKEGQPIHGDLVSLEKREDGFFNVKRTRLGTSAGPRQVATNTYRENYDKIFKKNLN